MCVYVYCMYAGAAARTCARVYERGDISHDIILFNCDLGERKEFGARKATQR